MKEDCGSFVSSLGDSCHDFRGHENSSFVLDIESLHIEGRSRETSQLLQAFSKVKATRETQLVVVHGPSGSGKSSLVEHLGNMMAMDGLAYFVSGKFDQYNENDMFSGFVSAFSDLCDLVCQSQDTGEIRRELLLELKDDIQSLIRLIPSLYMVTGTANEIGGTKPLMDNSRAKFQLACLKFLHIMSKRTPTVIFLDDFHWANEFSRSMLMSLLTKSNPSKNLLVICAYRNDEFKLEWPFSPEDCGQYCTIQVENLNLDAINQIVSILTFRSLIETRPFSEIVFNKTEGNPYHTLQYLESLVIEELLIYCENSGQWRWDLDLIQAETKVSDNIAGIVSTKIQRIPVGTQEILKIAASVGFSFNINVLKTIAAVWSSQETYWSDTGNPLDKSSPDILLEKCLELATREGLIEEGKTNEMKFTHDRVHQCIMLMIGKEREKFHLRIGQILRKSLNNDSECWFVLLTTEQMNRGAPLVQGPAEIIDLVELNLKAAKVATSKSAFDLAMTYLKEGIALIGRFHADPWNKKYYLCHEVFSCGAEVGLSIGDFEDGEKMIDEVINHSSSLEDKLPAYYSKVKIIGALGRQTEAISTAISVLREIGYNFPKKPNKGHVALELLKTKRRARTMDIDAFMALPIETDSKRIYGMKLMSEIVTRGQLCGSKACFSFACLRMVRSSIKHGLSGHSLYGLAKYGMILSILGANDEAYRIGRLTMRLLDRLDDTDDIETKCILSIFGFLNHLRQPVKQGQESLLRAYRRGMLHGDVQWALMAGAYVCLSALCYGDNLLELEDFMTDLLTFLRAFNVEFTLGLFLTTIQAIHNLLGHREDPHLLKGAAMDEFEVLPSRAKEGFAAWSRAFYEFMLACYFDKWEDAEQAHDEIQKYALGGNYVRAYFSHSCSSLLVGIMSFARYEVSGKRAHRSRGMKCIDFASKMVKEGMVAFVPVLSILLAEKAALSGRKSVVRQAYDSAVAAVIVADTSNFAGMACERAASHFEKTDVNTAEDYLLTAKEQYTCYGAPVLVQKVEDKIALLYRGENLKPG